MIVTPKKPNITPLNLAMIPFDTSTCVYGDNEFILSDNFSSTKRPKDFANSDEVQAIIHAPYPFRIQFTMALFCLEGALRVRFNLVEYTIQKNDILIVQEGTIGEFLDTVPNCKIVLIAMSSNYFIPDAASKGFAAVQTYLTSTPILHISDEAMKEMMTLYQLMRHKIQQKDFQYTRESLKAYMNVFSCECCQFMQEALELQEAQPFIKTRQKQMFERFISLVKEYHSSEREIGFYAHKMCVTPKYLSQTIYTASGKHASEWIRDYVIIEAKVLLKSEQYSIQQVSDMLHFPNQSFFGSYFKKYVGCSPKAY